MAWFNEKETTLGAVTVERVLQRLDNMGYQVQRIPDEPVLGASFNEIPMVFDMSNTDFMRVHAMPRIEVSLKNRRSVLEFCNNWNADSLWGTAYLYETEDSEEAAEQLCVDVSTRVSEGLTDEQLDAVLDMSLTVTIDCVETYLGKND